MWLCRPGQPDDPCSASLETTVVGPDGARRIVDYDAAKDPPIDCFYVYPNVSHQDTPNANVEVDAQEEAIAELEASPFSQDCRVFAPMYRESTGRATSPASKSAASSEAYESLLSAWDDYLVHYNHGRGFVLIGHSEGASLLAGLITAEIDRVPAVRRLFVSAILTGTDLVVYKRGSGPLKTIGPCESPAQIGCIVGYNAYYGSLPADAMFGRPESSDLNGEPVEDVCTDPQDLTGPMQPLVSMYRLQLPTEDVAGSTTNGVLSGSPPTTSTPWIEFDGSYTSRCVSRDGFDVMLVSSSSSAPSLSAHPNESWGLHVDDPNIAMGNLISLVRSQAAAYLSR